MVTNALGMAINSRNTDQGTLIHSDQGTQFTPWAFTHRAKASGWVPSMGSIGDPERRSRWWKKTHAPEFRVEAVRLARTSGRSIA